MGSNSVLLAGTANSGFLPRRPIIGTCFAFGKIGHWRACCPAMTKQSGFPKSKWLDDLLGDLPGVVLPCFHCNDSILEALGNSQPNFSSDPAFCKVYPLVLSSFKDQQCFAYIDTPLREGFENALI